MNDDYCIELKGVNKYYGKKQVLKDINLQVPYGQIFGILGPSGCGKTTIVKIMTGILPANSGEVFVLKEAMPQLGVMNKIGYMAQSDALYNTLSARENLKFFGTVYGMKNAYLNKRIHEVMALVKLSDDLDKEVMAYSGGMKRRLSLAIAILHSPPVLLLDEPTVGIDPLLRQDIWSELYKMTDQGVTIIVTTHVMDEADKCDRLAMMRDGMVIAQGTSDELQARIGAKTIEEAFIHYGGNKYEG